MGKRELLGQPIVTNGYWWEVKFSHVDDLKCVCRLFDHVANTFFGHHWIHLIPWTTSSPLRSRITPCQSGSSRPEVVHLAIQLEDETIIETPSPPCLLHLQCYLHLASSGVYSKILGHTFHTWLPDNYVVIFSHGSPFSIYKRPLTFHHKRENCTLSLFELEYYYLL